MTITIDPGVRPAPLTDAERIAALERQVADLKAQLPRSPVAWSITLDGYHCGNLFETEADAQRVLAQLNTAYPEYEPRRAAPWFHFTKGRKHDRPRTA